MINYYYRKQKLLVAGLFIFLTLIALGASAQVVSSYSFSQSNGTYVPITGGTILVTATGTGTNTDASLDQGNYTVSFPFNFTFNGTVYTSCNANGNGYITFGATLPTTGTTTPISSTTAYSGAVAAMARDIWGVFGTGGTRATGSAVITGVTNFTGIAVGKALRGTGIPAGATVSSFNIGAGTITMSVNATSNSATWNGWPNGMLRTETIGVAPNRTVVIQWSGMSDFVISTPNEHTMDFQIRLNEGGGVVANQTIDIVYGPSANVNATARTNQVGLRGATNADFNNRSSTTDWSATIAGTINTSSVTRTNVIIPASGLNFTWSPPNVCTGTPAPGNTLSTSTSQCSGVGFTLSLQNNPPVTGFTYQWQSSPDGVVPFADIGGANSSTLATSQTSTKYYRCKVTCSNGGAFDFSNPLQIVTLGLFPAGTYTINNNLPTGGSNFQTFTAAVNALACGINGAVIFNVDSASNPYTEQVLISSILGSSSTNTVTFNGNGCTLQATPVSATRYIIRLDGADFITFNNLVIKGLATDYDWGIHLINGADDNTIDSCTIDISANTSTTQSNSAGVVASNSSTSVISAGNNANNLTISNCTIKGAYQGIILNGLATGLNAVNNHISNNNILDTYANGIELTHNDGALIEGNNIARPTRTIMLSTSAGIEIGAGNRNVVINANRIHDTHNSVLTQSGTAYGIYFNACDAPSGQANKVTNNLIYNFNSLTGTQYGLYNVGSDGVYYYHNTVVLSNSTSTSGTTYAFHQTTAATDIQVINNILVVSRSGTGTKNCLRFAQTASTIISNNNDLFINSVAGTNGVGFYSINYVTLNDWKTNANGGIYDGLSKSINPGFVSPGTGNFTPSANGINNQGALLPVPTDITGAIRNTPPDPGAYEFSPPPLDALLSWVAPAAPVTTGLNTVIINVVNNSTDTIFDVDLTYTDGTIFESQTFTALNIPFGGSQQVSFSVPYNITGSVSLQAYLSAVNGLIDADQGNDTTSQFICLPLSGNYTINSLVVTGGTNFQTFGNAISALVSCGVSGPIVFDVNSSSGPYNEQVIIPAIAGTSAVNTITFNGNGRTVTFNSTNGNERAVIKLNGADYITLDSLVITAPGTATTEYGFGVQLLNNADNNTIKHCTINITQASTSTTNYAGVLINSTATATITAGPSLCDNNTITGNTINGGYMGIGIVANSNTSEVSNNIITNNVIRDFYLYGIHLNGNHNTLVEGNDLSRPLRAAVTEFRGVYLTTNNRNCHISKNRIHNPFDIDSTQNSGNYGINLNLSNASAGNENVISNNLIYNMKSGQTTTNQNGILVNNSAYIKIYHNTIVLDDAYSLTTTGGTRGIYMQAPAASNGIDIKNNIIVISRGGNGPKQCIYYEGSGISLASNHNDLLMASTSGSVIELAFANGSGYANLASWQAGSGQDINSVSVNPVFVSPGTGNFTPTSVATDDIGMPVGITTDITGASRSLTAPDPGAYEFSITTPMDIGAQIMVTPGVIGCYSSSQGVVIRIKNYGSAVDFSLNPATVSCYVSGTITDTLTGTPAGIIPTNGTMDIALSGTIDMSVGGVYNFDAFTSAANDANTSNDAMPTESRTKAPISPGTVASSDTAFCISGIPVLTLSGNSGGDIQWQESSISNSGPWTNINGTSSFTPSSALTQTTYYRVVTTCELASDSSNVMTVLVSNPAITGTAPGTRCGLGQVTIGATADAGSVVNWYTTPSGGTPVATGPTYTTPVISTSTNYYASASSAGATTQVSSNGIPNVTTSTQNSGLLFTLFENVTLNSIQVYSTAAGTVTVTIKNSALVTLFTSPAIPIIASTLSNPQTIALGWSIPAGTDYRILVSNTGNALGYSSGAFPAPMGNGVGTITNGATATGTSTLNYFVYNMNTSTGCESGRTLVSASVTPAPPISITGTTGICQGSSTTLSIGTGLSDYTTFAWSPATGLSSTTGSSVSASPAATTKYYVLASGNVNDCQVIDSITVVVNTIPLIVEVDNPLVCGNASAQLNANTGPGTFTYAWSPSTGLSSTTIANPTAQLASASQAYSVTVTNTSTGCTKSGSITLIKSDPQVTSTTGGSRCGIGTVTLSASGTASQVNWWNQAVGGSLLSTGPTYSPTVSTTTTFYAAVKEVLPQSPVSTGFGGGTTATDPNAAGNMFNIKALHDIKVTGFDIHLNNNTSLAPSNISVYYRLGGYQGFTTNPGAWLLAGSVNGVVSSGNNVATPLPLALDINIQANQTYGFYIVVTNLGVSNSLRYFSAANSPPEGGVAVADYNLQVIGGTTVFGPFTGLPAAPINRLWNGNVKYSIGCESARSAVVANVTTPPVLTVTTSKTVCFGTIVPLTVTSSTVDFNQFTWAPITNLYTDSAATVHYTGGNATTVFAKATVSGNVTYTCTATNFSTLCANAATTSVFNQPAAMTVSSSSANFCISGTATLSMSPLSGYAPGSIQWQSSPDSVVFTDIPSATNSSYTTPVITSTKYYRAVVKDGNNNVCLQGDRKITVNNPQITGTTPGSRCGTGTVLLQAAGSPGSIINWYADSLSSIPVSSGNSFTTPVISTTTKFYVTASDGGSSFSIGAPNNGQNTGYTLEAGLFFTVQASNINLQGVYVYPVGTGAGTVEIALRNSSGTNIQTLTANLTGTTAPGIKTFVPLNFSIPAGNYSLVMLQRTGLVANLVRDGSAAITGGGFPFTMPGVMSITSGNCCSGQTTNTSYYYFYDWQVSSGCENVKTPVTATVTPAPAITTSSSMSSVCSGGSANLSVSSGNPGYSYTWTPGNQQTSAITVTPVATTTYTVSAVDTTAGTNGGCTAIENLTVNVLPATATIAASPNSICVSGSTTLNLTPLNGYPAGSLQWQSSPDSVVFTDIPGATNPVYATPILTSTTYYRAVIKNSSNNVCIQPTIKMVITNPQVIATSGATRCGPGPVTLQATGTGSGTLEWFKDSIGGTLLGTGNSFSPSVSATTKYFVQEATAGGTGGTRLAITEIDIGTNDRIEITNVSGQALNVNGWKVVASNNYTNINAVNANIQVLSGVMNPGDIKSWTDASAGPNYWGSNLLFNPGAYPSFTGWVAILDSTGNLIDFVPLNWQSADIQGAVITVGSSSFTVGSKWIGNGIDQSSVATTQGIARKGSVDNNDLNDFEIINLTMGSLNPNISLPFSGFGCASVRTGINVTVTPSPAISVSPGSSICEGMSVNLSASSVNDPNYTYTWTPTDSVGSVFIATPLISTVYTVTAVDSSAGPNYGCAAIATVGVTVNPLPDFIAATSAPFVCQGSDAMINVTSESTTNTYSWSPADGLSATTGSSVTALSVGANTTYTVTATTTAGCTSTSSVTVNVTPLPLSYIYPNDTILCTGSVINIVARNNSAYAGGWPLGTVFDYGFGPTSDSTFLVNGPGVYSAIVSLPVSLGSCTSTSPVANIEFMDAPVLFLSTDAVKCNGTSTGFISSQVFLGSPPYRFIYYNATGNVIRDTTTSLTEDTLFNVPAGQYSVIAYDTAGSVYPPPSCKSDSVLITVEEPTLLVASEIHTAVDCNGGTSSVTISATGGVPPYTGEGTFSQAEGTQLYTVTDANGCTSQVTAVVAEPAILVSTPAVTYNACGYTTGNIASTVSGGTAPYSYNWSTGATTASLTNQPAGTFTVTVTDANGCITSASGVVTPPGVLTVASTGTNLLCRGVATGTITLTVSGGVPAYSYQWNGGNTNQNRTGLAAGTYTVTVTDINGCTKTKTTVITQPATNMLVNTSQTNIRCYGLTSGVASVSPSGGTAPYTYSWNTIPVKTTASISGLTSGVYTCTITDAIGCVKNVVITITQPTDIAVFQTQTNVTFPGGNDGTASVSVSGGTAPYAYSWNTVPVKTTATVTGLTAGTYKCTVTDAKSCIKKVTFIITEPIAKPATGPANTWEIRAYPNPTSGVIMLAFENDAEEQFNLALLDITGRMLLSEDKKAEKGPNEYIFDFTGFSKGVYFIRLSSAARSKMIRIVVE